MSSLPPYSTYRTDNKQMMYPQAISHGNVLTFTPPGFRQTLNVKFPDCRLAVCEKCKKNYKTRDMCRVRNSHTAPPWTTAYVCITLDDTCTDENGNYIQKPMTVRMVQWQPFQAKENFNPKTPVCSACKKTNRTRNFCRERHNHRQLPWCTVYVLLSALESTDPATVVAAPSKMVEGKVVKNEAGENGLKDQVPDPSVQKDEEDGAATQSELQVTQTEGPVKAESATGDDAEEKTEEAAPPPPKPKVVKTGEDDDGEDINNIAESRTFLAKVSCRSISIHWLELADYDATDSGVHGFAATENHLQNIPPMQSQSSDPNQSQYYNGSQMGYQNPQQHQHALKSHQQYFFQMQQRQQQQYAAQAAWQVQYNQGMPGAPVPPGQAMVTPPSAAPVPAQNPGDSAAPAPGAPATVQPSASPVTAGEAAAQQQQYMQQQVHDQQSQGQQQMVHHTQAPQPAGQQQATAPVAVPADSQQQQWQPQPQSQPQATAQPQPQPQPQTQEQIPPPQQTAEQQQAQQQAQQQQTWQDPVVYEQQRYQQQQQDHQQQQQEHHHQQQEHQHQQHHQQQESTVTVNQEAQPQPEAQQQVQPQAEPQAKAQVQQLAPHAPRNAQVQVQHQQPVHHGEQSQVPAASSHPGQQPQAQLQAQPQPQQTEMLQSMEEVAQATAEQNQYELVQPPIQDSSHVVENGVRTSDITDKVGALPEPAPVHPMQPQQTPQEHPPQQNAAPEQRDAKRMRINI